MATHHRTRRRSPRKGARRRRNGRSRAPRSSRSSVRRQDALSMLRADHERVGEMFARFENVRGDDRKEKLVEDLCKELEVHAQLEEEIFYPAVRAAIDDDDLMDEAKVEHRTLKDLIGQLRAMSARDALYDATVKVLGEYVKHHVREEQGEMFAQARSSGVDRRELGEQMQARRDQITSGMIDRLKRIVR